MKKKLITFMLFLACIECFAQSFQSEIFDPDSVNIYKAECDRLRKIYDDSAALWKQESYTYDCYYSYGEVTLITSGNVLRILLMDDGGEYGGAVTAYYFRESKLYYVKSTGDYWTPQISEEEGLTASDFRHEEISLYYYNNSPFDCSSRELIYVRQEEMEAFSEIAPEVMDCSLRYDLDQVNMLFLCYPFRNFTPCLCGD